MATIAKKAGTPKREFKMEIAGRPRDNLGTRHRSPDADRGYRDRAACASSSASVLSTPVPYGAAANVNIKFAAPVRPRHPRLIIEIPHAGGDRKEGVVLLRLLRPGGSHHRGGTSIGEPASRVPSRSPRRIQVAVGVEAVEAWWIPSPRRGLDRRACKQATRRASLDGSRYYTSGC